jgi:geranylgeranyl diphosphate synthase type II
MPSEAVGPARSFQAQPSPARRADELVAQAHAFVDDWLARALPGRDAPPRRLHCAMHDALFPGGRRTRPISCRLVAELYGNGDDELVGRFAAAVELVHCASLVQGAPACHAVYGKATAILAGDALLTLAFETLANAPPSSAPVAFQLMGLLAAASRDVELAAAALFRASLAGAAIICGADGDVPRWARLGELAGAGAGSRAAIRAAVRELAGAAAAECEALERVLSAVAA